MANTRGRFFRTIHESPKKCTTFGFDGLQVPALTKERLHCGQPLPESLTNNTFSLNLIICKQLYTHVMHLQTFIQSRLQVTAIACSSRGTTIHKSQGMPVSHVIIVLSHKYTKPGQAYVALSLVKTLTVLVLIQFTKKAIKTFKKVKAEMERLKNLLT